MAIRLLEFVLYGEQMALLTFSQKKVSIHSM